MDDWLSALAALFDRLVLKIASIQDSADASVADDGDGASDRRDLLATLIKLGDFVARTACDGVGDDIKPGKERMKLLAKVCSVTVVLFKMYH